VKRTGIGIFILVLVTAGTTAGYWWGSHQTTQAIQVPEHTDHGQQAMGQQASMKERKILYYRHPMGLSDTSPVPKKDGMGMEYTPVYEGGEPAVGGAGKISLDKVQKLGVKTERVTLRDLTRAVRAVGTIEANERLTYTITPKFDGWVERLYVNTTGEPVQRGQALLDVYSPELVATQQEYLIALTGAQAVKDADPEIQERMQELVDSALQRLDYWDISPKELRELRTERKIKRVLTFRSPVNGVVLDKPVLKGMRFMPGDMLYKIADLSTVWLIAEIFEQDLGLVRAKQQVRIGVETYPGKDFTGTLAFVYPTLNPGTRTGRVRVEIPNPDLLLKPAMYANVEIATDDGEQKVLAVPDSAVLDSGVRQIVLIERGEGLFEPREVKLGARADGYFEVLDGLREEDQVVVSANFLIDADSNMKAALGGFGGHSGHGTAPAAAADGIPPPAGMTTESSGPSSGATEHTGH